MVHEIIPAYINGKHNLVGGFNPFEKYAGEIGSFPQGSGWTLKIFELPPPTSSNPLCNPTNQVFFIAQMVRKRTEMPPLSIIGFTHSKRSPLGIRMPQDLWFFRLVFSVGKRNPAKHT